MPARYMVPRIEVAEISVEEGFAASVTVGGSWTETPWFDDSDEDIFTF